MCTKVPSLVAKTRAKVPLYLPLPFKKSAHATACHGTLNWAGVINSRQCVVGKPVEEKRYLKFWGQVTKRFKQFYQTLPVIRAKYAVFMSQTPSKVKLWLSLHLFPGTFSWQPWITSLLRFQGGWWVVRLAWKGDWLSVQDKLLVFSLMSRQRRQQKTSLQRREGPIYKKSWFLSPIPNSSNMATDATYNPEAWVFKEFGMRPEKVLTTEL